MVHQDDKYAGEEEHLTQVRSIIKQLNEEKPAQERTREVVVRADGTKVVRVTKKRRVMMTSADVRRRNRRQLLVVMAAFVLLLAGCGAWFMYRMSVMSSSAYLNEQQAALQQAWGASSVTLAGKGVDGTSLKLNSLEVDFPESSMIQRVEITGVEAELGMMSFLTGVPEAEELQLDRVFIQLRPGAAMDMPMQAGMDKWFFRRINCKEFTVQFGEDGEAGPMALRGTQAYMYYPGRARNASVVTFRGGNLVMKNWKTMRISEGKARVSADGITDFSLSGTTDATSDVVEQRRTSFAVAGAIANKSDFTGPYSIKSDNMSLADFTEGRLEEFFTARTVAQARGKAPELPTMQLSAQGEKVPVFRGQFHLKDICLSSFPALMAICEHIEPAKRRLYNPISLHRGYVVLDSREGELVAEVPEDALQERDLASLSGKLVLNAANELSGELRYGIPQVLARVEYPDGHPDPIFTASGEWAVLSTRLKGRGNMPGDDMAEVEARAAIARRERPERIPFDKLDVNQLTEQLVREPAGQIEYQTAPQPAPAGANPFEASSDNPFEVSEDPFAPSTPF